MGEKTRSEVHNALCPVGFCCYALYILLIYIINAAKPSGALQIGVAASKKDEGPEKGGRFNDEEEIRCLHSATLCDSVFVRVFSPDGIERMGSGRRR